MTIITIAADLEDASTDKPEPSFAKTLQQLMRERGLNQIAIARGVGVSHVAVRRWLHMGSIPRGDHLIRLADFLAVHPRDLIPA